MRSVRQAAWTPSGPQGARTYPVVPLLLRRDGQRLAGGDVVDAQARFGLFLPDHVSALIREKNPVDRPQARDALPLLDLPAGGQVSQQEFGRFLFLIAEDADAPSSRAVKSQEPKADRNRRPWFVRAGSEDQGCSLVRDHIRAIGEKPDQGVFRRNEHRCRDLLTIGQPEPLRATVNPLAVR